MPGSSKYIMRATPSRTVGSEIVMKITATIITHNEARNIREACESVAWADEVLIVDSDSTDGTHEIAAAAGILITSYACTENRVDVGRGITSMSRSNRRAATRR